MGEGGENLGELAEDGTGLRNRLGLGGSGNEVRSASEDAAGSKIWMGLGGFGNEVHRALEDAAELINWTGLGEHRGLFRMPVSRIWVQLGGMKLREILSFISPCFS